MTIQTFCAILSPGQPKPYVHSNLPNVNLDSRLVKDHQFSPSINPVKTQQYSTSIQEIMRAHQTLRDLPHVPVSPQQRYVLTEPTINHCDILRITAQLGVMGKLNPQEFHLGQEVFNLGDNYNTATSRLQTILFKTSWKLSRLRCISSNGSRSSSTKNLMCNARFPNFIWSEGGPNLISCPNPWILTPREFSP
jgi:hypothetical protein